MCHFCVSKRCGLFWCYVLQHCLQARLCRRAWIRLLLLSQRHRISATGQTQMCHWDIFFFNILCSVLLLDERLSVWGHSGKPNHGPPCKRAEPPVRGPEHRPGSAASQPGKGEYHTWRYSFIYQSHSKNNHRNVSRIQMSCLNFRIPGCFPLYLYVCLHK